MPNPQQLLTVIGLWTMTAATGLATEAWDRFLGPNGRPVSDAKTVPVNFTMADYNWQVPVPGKGHSSPVIWGNKLFLTTVVGEDQRQVICFDTESGNQLWTWEHKFEPHNKHRDNEFASSTPCLDENHIYIGWTTGTSAETVALDHEGNLVWERTLGTFQGDHGSGSSPVLSDGAVFYFWDDLASAKTVYTKLDPKTGEDLWRVEMPWPSGRGELKTTYSSPLVYTNSHGVTEIVISSMIFGVLSLDSKTGETLWQFDDGFNQRTVGSPVMDSGVIFATWGSGNGAKDHIALIPGSESKTGKPEVVWKKTSNKGMPYVPTVLPANGRLYMWGDSGTLLCVDIKTGETIFGPERVDGSYYSNPVLIDGKIYCVSRGMGGTPGEVVVAEAGDELNILARNALESGAAATPAVANGALFIRTYDHLISVGGK